MARHQAALVGVGETNIALLIRNHTLTLVLRVLSWWFVEYFGFKSFFLCFFYTEVFILWKMKVL